MNTGNQDDKKIFLTCASRIGSRICEQAEWADDICTWNINRIDREFQSPERRLVKERAGGTVYRGSAGIALFLGELYRQTGNSIYGDTAAGAMGYALKEAARLAPSNFGFHSGRVGIAWVASRLADCLDMPDYLQEAEHVLEPLLGNENRDRGIDVIAGAAGAIPALLQINEKLPHELTVDMALNLGEHLINVAHKEPIGWSWDTIRSSAVRHLCGLAHGAAGIGHAFLELYHATGATRYLYVAEQAFLYERQFLSKEKANWPDFRYTEISEYLHHDRIEELRIAVGKDDLAPYEIKYMSAWCHGAPGIGLTRLRAYDLLNYPVYRMEAECAIEATQRSLNISGGNYSLCHGHAGNVETLLYASEVLQDETFGESARAYALKGWKQYEDAGQTWPSGIAGAPADAGLMLGEGGIGYFYLRLYSDSIPSVMLLHAPKEVKPLAYRAYYSRHDNYAQSWFGRTLCVMGILQESDHTPNILNSSVKYSQLPPASADVKPTDITTMYENIKTFITQAKEPHKTFLQDAFLPEQVRYEMTLKLTNFTQEFLHELNRKPAEEIFWANATVSLAEHARVISCRYDWDEWLNQCTDDRSVTPKNSTAFFLIYRKNNRMHERHLNTFAALVLRELIQPINLTEIVTRVAYSLDDRFERAVLHAAIVEQLEEAYSGGILTCLFHSSDGSNVLHEYYGTLV